MLARTGLDDLLDGATARPGTPFCEPGTRARVVAEQDNRAY